MHVALAVSFSSYDDGCPDDRAALGRTPCCWLVCLSDGRDEGTAALLPGPASPVLSLVYPHTLRETPQTCPPGK